MIRVYSLPPLDLSSPLIPFMSLPHGEQRCVIPCFMLQELQYFFKQHLHTSMKTDNSLFLHNSHTIQFFMSFSCSSILLLQPYKILSCSLYSWYSSILSFTFFMRVDHLYKGHFFLLVHMWPSWRQEEHVNLLGVFCFDFSCGRDFGHLKIATEGSRGGDGAFFSESGMSKSLADAPNKVSASFEFSIGSWDMAILRILVLPILRLGLGLGLVV